MIFMATLEQILNSSMTRGHVLGVLLFLKHYEIVTNLKSYS